MELVGYEDEEAGRSLRLQSWEVHQIRTIDKSRLIKYMGKLNENIMSKINNAIAIQMGLWVNNSIISK